MKMSKQIEKALVMTAEEMRRALIRIAHEICERNRGVQQLAFIGIHSRGDALARRIAANIAAIEELEPPVGAIDITLHRDDLDLFNRQALAGSRTSINFAIDGMRVILVDDVLYTGRTIRAALDALTHFGRPASVQLAALIDRGHRELPIAADYVGKNIPTSKRETVVVAIEEKDGRDAVTICEEADE